VKEPTTWQISNFIGSFDSTELFMNTNSFDFSLYNNKLQDSTVFSYTYYSMTLNPSGFCSNKSEFAIVIDSGASGFITPITSDFIGRMPYLATQGIRQPLLKQLLTIF